MSRSISLVIFLCCLDPLQAQTQNDFYYYRGQKIALIPSTRLISRQLRSAAAPGKFPALERLASKAASDLERLGEKVYVASSAVQAALSYDLSVGGMTSELLSLPTFDIGPSIVIVQPQVIVRFKETSQPVANRALLAKFSNKIEPLPGQELYLVHIENPNSTLAIANILHDNATVQSAAPNFVTVSPYLSSTNHNMSASCPPSPAIPDRNLQWNHQRLSVSKAWTISRGDKVRIAILDDGVDFTHPALASRKDAEWDAFTQQPSVTLNGSDTHGTRVAGIVAAQPSGKDSFCGLSPGAKLIGIRVGSRDELYDFTDDVLMLRGIAKARELHADVLNISMYTVPSDVVTHDLLSAAKFGRVRPGNAPPRGIVIVAAAGNSGGPLLYPASLAKDSEIIAVGASDKNDVLKAKQSKSDWASNTGPGLSVAAPGVDLVTTAISRTYDCSFAGTSAAAPQVAAIVALLLSKESDLTSMEVKARILQSADHPASLVKLGRVNACKSLLLSDCN